MTADEEQNLTWTRLEAEDEYTGEEIFVELAVDGKQLFIRRGGEDRDDKLDVREFKSAGAAAKSLSRRVDEMKRRGYLSDDPVQRPRPSRSNAPAKSPPTSRRVTRFVDNAPSFFAHWQDRGYDPTRSFLAEAQRLGVDASKLVRECLALAESCFGVQFLLQTIVDEEHGTVGPIEETFLAEFYRDPRRVAAISELKALGSLPQHDGEHDQQLDHAGRVETAFEAWRTS